MTEQLVRLDHALDQISALLGRVRPDQAGDPTPCAEWDVAALAEHVVADLDRFTVAARGERPDWGQPVPPVGGGWRAAFDRGATALRSAWIEAGDLTVTVQLPIGEMPRSFILSQQTAEFAVHAWDLDRATGHTGQLDEDLAAAALAWANQTLKPEYRGEGKAFGAEVPVPADAPATARLAGFFGRSPGWTP
jgi:uncharacterized protein (TIGR03086 family)